MGKFHSSAPSPTGPRQGCLLYTSSEKKHKNTLEEDIHLASDWVVKALNSSGYKADYSLESMKEIDRFFDEQSSETGLLSKNRGEILFGLASYIGESAIRLYGCLLYTSRCV